MSPAAAGSQGRPDRRQELLAPELLRLFDDRFVRSCELLEEYVGRLAVQIVRDTGLEDAAQEPGSVAELVARAGLDPRRARIPVRWLLGLLERRGLAERERDQVGTPRFRVLGAQPELPPEAVYELQDQHDPTALPAYDIARLAASGYAEFLRAQRRGEELLFSAEGMALWGRYFSGDNPLYAINNAVGAVAVTEWIDEPGVPGGGGRWLELGGGLGSGALALLARLEQRGRLVSLASYRFTELAPRLLARGSRSLLDRFGDSVVLDFARLDMDRPFSEQGVEKGSIALVYAVNTLHVARDLAYTLYEIRETLVPGGWLIVSECLRPFAGRPIYTELAFLLLEAYREPKLDPELRPEPGFMTPEQWQTALLAGGFEAVRFLPDVRELRHHFPSFVVGAIGARRPAG